MRTKFRQCVCCGYNALRGTNHYIAVGNTKTKTAFVCAACESENIEEDERRYDQEEWSEVERLGARAVERF